MANKPMRLEPEERKLIELIRWLGIPPAQVFKMVNESVNVAKIIEENISR